MADSKKIRLTIVTPAHAVYGDDVASVVLPAFDGEWAVLPGHADLMALLGCGRLTATLPDGARKFFALRGGFVQVSHNVVTVLTPDAEAAEGLNAEAVAREVAELHAQHPKPAEKDAHAASLAWALARRKALDSHQGVSAN